MDAQYDGGRVNEPPRIVTDWRRFADGLWRLPRGDISAAYCADVFPRLKVFTQDNRVFMNGGSHFGRVIGGVADCFPLIPPNEYHGPEQVKYSYEGAMGRYQGEQWRLGPKTVFESDDPTIREWEWILRILYADGGMFASGVTYREFLTDRLSPESPNERIAHRGELHVCEVGTMPRTQGEMKRFLIETGSTSLPMSKPQLEFAL